MTNKRQRSFTVIGAGRSGIGVSKLLAEKGNRVVLYDEKEENELKYLDRASLTDAGIELSLGQWDDSYFNCDAVIKSPGVPSSNEIIAKATVAGIKILSEIEAAYEYCPCPIVAVTGTNGKTTTTVLAGEMFRNAGFDVRVCGNVGLAFSEVVSGLSAESIVVLEVSSYQLEDIYSFRPAAGIMMNITPDHLDRHGSFENYLAAKMRIAENMDDECLLIVNYDDEILRAESKKVNAPKAFFGMSKEVFINTDIGAYSDGARIYFFDKEKELLETIMETREINIRGMHNLYNSLAAAISARVFGIEKEMIASTLRKFPGVEHRIEFVRELRGIRFFNDSKATNVESMSVALDAFEGGIILIMGGREKGNDYSHVDDAVKQKVKMIIAIGESKDKVKKHFESMVIVEEADSMKDAVMLALNSGESGDSILLSPACKSFDMFDSFEHRGEVFKKAVNELE